MTARTQQEMETLLRQVENALQEDRKQRSILLEAVNALYQPNAPKAAPFQPLSKELRAAKAAPKVAAKSARQFAQHFKNANLDWRVQEAWRTNPSASALDTSQQANEEISPPPLGIVSRKLEKADGSHGVNTSGLLHDRSRDVGHLLDQIDYYKSQNDCHRNELEAAKALYTSEQRKWQVERAKLESDLKERELNLKVAQAEKEAILSHHKALAHSVDLHRNLVVVATALLEQHGISADKVISIQDMFARDLGNIASPLFSKIVREHPGGPASAVQVGSEPANTPSVGLAIETVSACDTTQDEVHDGGDKDEELGDRRDDILDVGTLGDGSPLSPGSPDSQSNSSSDDEGETF